MCVCVCVCVYWTRLSRDDAMSAMDAGIMIIYCVTYDTSDREGAHACVRARARVCVCACVSPSDGSGEVDFEEFQGWYATMKTGVGRPAP